MKEYDPELSRPDPSFDASRRTVPVHLVSIDWETADELLTTSLRVDDPNELPGVIDIVPQGVEPVEIVHWYNRRDLVIRCSFCPQHQRHNRGLVVRLPDGSLALMGHDCIASHKLGNFEEIRKQFDHQVSLQFYLQRVRPLEEAITRATPILAEWRHALGQLREFRECLCITFPTLFEELTEAAERYGGRLEAEREERDLAAEERRDRRVGKDAIKFGEPIYKPTTVLVGRMIGYQFLINDELFSAFSRAERTIRSAQTALQQRGDRAFLQELRRAFMDVKDARDDLGKAADSYDQFKRFISDSNLKLIAKWAREVLSGRYELRGRGLICKHEWDDSAAKVLKIPRNLPELNVEVIDILNLDSKQQ